MKIWKVHIKDEIKDKVFCYIGTATIASAAEVAAFQLANMENDKGGLDCNNLYVDFVSCLGEQSFGM